MIGRGSSVFDDLAGSGLSQVLADGEVVFAEGTPADAAYVVISGSCAVFEGDDEVSVIHAGELFGEMAAIRGGTRTATVRAVGVTEVLRISPSQLHESLTSSPELFWRVIETMTRRLRSVSERQVAYREEHKALQEVQRSLLPDLERLGELDQLGFAVEARWEPCTYASGDSYDVVPIDVDRHLITIGDVMGHGAESSLMMAIARSELHELARSFRRTDELLLRLDGYLRDNAPPKQGMSLAVAVHDRANSVIEYSAAGHPLPLLVRDREVTTLPGRPGVLLALPFVVGSGYDREEIEVRPGDQLVFVTDGCYEVVVDDDGARLGVDGLAGVVAGLAARGPVSIDELFDRITELDRAERADDDRTALIVTFA